MKKILYGIMAACLALGCMTSCSKDYEEATEEHVYGDSENPPLKGSDANMPVEALTMMQANAGTETKVISLSDYSDKISEQLGMSLDEAIAGISDGSVKFVVANPNRRLWDKTAANAGDNKWAVSASGVITDEANACATVEFVPSAKEIRYQLTSNAAAGIIPIIVGLVKTDNSAYKENFRIQVKITVTDASVVEVSISVPSGSYVTGPIALADYKTNIEYAFPGVSMYDLTAGLYYNSSESPDPPYDILLMDDSGSLYGGPGTYTANGAGYWLTEGREIVSWGAEGYAFFIEPALYDEETSDYYADGGYINVGRLSEDTPAPGTTIAVNVVVKQQATGKTLTLMVNAYFE